MAGGSGLGHTTGYVEMTLDDAIDFTVTDYKDIVEYKFNNPRVFDIYDTDMIIDDMSGNIVTMRSEASGMGTMQVMITDPQGNTSELFDVPYVVYDMSNFTLVRDESTKTLSVNNHAGTLSVGDKTDVLGTGVTSIEIYSAPNKKVMTLDGTSVRADLSSLQPGTYIVKITRDRDYYYKLVI